MSVHRLPSVRTLQAVFGDKARQARHILEMSRRELVMLDAGARRVKECWNPPATFDIRMECLNALAETHGVEYLATKKGDGYYLNTGDSYAPTLVRYRARYQVASWGDICERDGWA